MRKTLGCMAILALTTALVVPVSAAAAEPTDGAAVAVVRAAAEEQLTFLGIDPAAAVFQIGARNYAGPDCPGSGWNCTSAPTVVQISAGAAASSANRFERCSSASCVIIQDSTATGGHNDARCAQGRSDDLRSSEEDRASDDRQTSSGSATQSCTITQRTTIGTNRASVSQLIDQSQAEGSQSATQTAVVHQTTSTGANESAVAQTIHQTESTRVAGSTGAAQKQEAHQTAFVCQGGAANPCFANASGSNRSSLAQTSFQVARVQFGAGATGAITQNQNTDASRPKSRAVVRQNAVDKTNVATLRQLNRQTGTVRAAERGDDDDSPGATAGFGGTVAQRQGNGSLCPSGGLCGFQFQNSTGVQRATEQQDEVQRLVAPPGASQIQWGPEFCCATQTGGNSANTNTIRQTKAQYHTSSLTQGHIQGHCDSANGDCTVHQTLTDNGTTKSNSCTGSFCNITVHCSTTAGEGGPFTSCTSSPEGPPPPCPPGSECVTLLWRDAGPVTGGAAARLWRDQGPATG